MGGVSFLVGKSDQYVKKRRGFRKIKLKSMKTAVPKGSVNMLQQADVVTFPHSNNI